MNLRNSWLIRLAIMAALTISLTPGGHAQTALRRGVVQFADFNELMLQSSSMLSNGFLAELETDPNFGGDFQSIYSVASDILDGYTIVSRGGYFPENAGIPREQQLTTSEAVYYIFALPNDNELILYRSPTENTARYAIRTARDDF